MFGQKWGFQRNRTKSEGGALLGDPKQQQASTSHPGKGGANHAHLGSQDSEEKAKGKRMLELCHEGNVTAVHQFCMSNAHSIFQSINSPMDVNLNTPLHLTVAQNDLVMTCLLLQKGADPNVANKSGVMPLSIAKRMGFVKIAKALVMHGAIIPLKEERVLYNGSAGSGASGSSSAAVGGGGGAGGGAGGPGGSDRRRDRRGHAKDPSLAATAASSSLPTSRDGGNTTNAAVAVTSVSNSVGSNGAGGGTDADFVGNVTLPVLGSSGGVTLFGSTAASAITDDDLIRREAFKDSIQSKVFPVYNAAFLGFKDPLLHALTPETIDAFDEAGWTCLMKAAYKGHLGLVTELVRRNASLDATDHHGYTALIWAIVAGRMNVVKFLVDEAGASIEGNRQEPQDSSSLSASGSRNDLNWQSRPSITPLIAATHYGHVEAVEYLLAKGANVNARAGTGKGRSALMIAAWTRRKNLVKLLLQNGAIVDPDVDSWLSKGIIHLKKVTVEQNVWLSHTGTDAYNALRRDHVSTSSMALHQAGIAAPGGIPPAGAQQTRRASLQDKVMYFSPEDSEIATEISEMLQRRAGAVAVGNSGLGVMGGDPSMIRSQTTQMSRMNMQRRRNMTFRQGLNLDKIIGNNSDMVMALAEHMPDRGTELDGLWIAVFQCVVQLVMAANKNIKHHYIAISAKAIHCASEIIRAIEMIDKTTCTAGKAPVTTASVAAAAAAAAVAAASGSGVAMAAKSASLASGTTGDLSMFSKTPVRARIKELSRTIGTEFPKQLMLSTRMAIGVWPPPAAVADMTGEAISLAASCRELVMLANTLGHYPVLDKNLEVSFHAFEESEDAGDELPSASSSSSASHSDSKLEAGTVFKGALSYSEYKRQNDLKLIEEMSKRLQMQTFSRRWTRCSSNSSSRSPSSKMCTISTSRKSSSRRHPRCMHALTL
ncbi:hypothetical protein BC831DRAFT_300150 [Entophlyctis helioformis]|nr:hypothetical protein BC831DRAFT_300150 [Entophlyctis helioformis]